MKIRRLLLIILPFLICGSCSVIVSTDDAVQPNVNLIGISNGKTASVNDASAPETLIVLHGKEVAAIASTKDSQGAKSIKLTFVSGGKFKSQSNRPALTRELNNTNLIRDGKANDWALIGATLIADSPGTNMVIRATGEDFAGNTISTETLTFIQKKPISSGGFEEDANGYPFEPTHTPNDVLSCTRKVVLFDCQYTTPGGVTRRECWPVSEVSANFTDGSAATYGPRCMSDGNLLLGTPEKERGCYAIKLGNSRFPNGSFCRDDRLWPTGTTNISCFRDDDCNPNNFGR